MNYGRVIDLIRKQWPKMSNDAVSGGRRAAIRLFCLECMGGSSKEVAICTAKKCPLWAFRSGHYSKKDAEVQRGQI